MKNNFKNDFPLLAESKIAYLDSAATSQKPEAVIRAVENFYRTTNANVHRGVYKISAEATRLFSDARQTVANFINASSSDEIIFTKNATEALNLLAYSYGMDNLNEGDEVVLTIMEHHSNLVPWQKTTKQKGAKLKYLYIDENYEIPDSELEKITEKTKIVSFVSVSNVLGTVNDVEKIVKKAHSVGAVAIADITQSVAHTPFDVAKTDVDFAVFSGHKMYAPLGIGVLYGKKELLEKMSPFLMGGDMIEYVYEQETTFAPLPNKFEAGTSNAAAAVGLAEAINYIKNIGFETIQKIENELVNYAIQELENLPYIEIYAPKNRAHHSGVISFNLKGIHPHDVSSLLDAEDVCVRSGNHCAQPLLRFLGIDSTCRASFAFYNTKEDVDKLVTAIKNCYNKFRKYLEK
ncbi:MAG: SufS family cysteine desulfurase [Clostridia bacterium]|nr:SufS family cysteine desulfurase [Clostridia bacterium]